MRWVLAVVVGGCTGGGPDADGDGWPQAVDCDDGDGGVHPAAAETCNGVDDDCDGQVDVGAGDAAVWFADGDGDGAGAAGSFTIACDAPPGSTADALDCDDGDATVRPGATESCNGRDDDCDGQVDEDSVGTVPRYLDLDGDGHGDPLAPELACVPPPNAVSLPDDCDDLDPLVHPGAAESCDGVDQDCDGEVDDDADDATAWHPDLDADGFGWIAIEVVDCSAPADWLADGTDCDDFDPANHPGAEERCDFVDNNCDALVDGADAIDPSTWYRDLDGDGFGSASTTSACAPPTDYVGQPGDCNDADDTVSPLASEDCGNAVDDDCNGLVDECGGAAPSVYPVDEIAAGSWTGDPDDGIESVVFAGDLDGDGFGDLALGAPLADAGAVLDPGVVFAVYGAASPAGPVDARTLAQLTGARASDRLSEYGNLASAGDLDGDGLSDLLVGAPEADDGAGNGDVGVVALRYGSAVRPTGTTDLTGADATFTSPVAYTRVGHGVSGLGDLDGDGLDDAAFASSENPSFDGTVYLLFGDPVRATGANVVGGLPSVAGEAFDLLGIEQGVTGVDLDGDGLSDLVMGGSTVNHHLYVLYGDPIRPASVAAGALPKVTDGSGTVTSEFGRLLRPGGDLDGDGYADLLATDFAYTSVGGSGSGQVWVLGGGAVRWTGNNDLAATSFATIEGVTSYGYCGWDARGTGDLSGDGVDDLAVSALYWAEPYAESGAVGVFQGPLDGAVRFDEADLRIEGAAGSSFLGSSLAAGDVDGDGWVDLAAAGPGVSGGAGAAYLVLGGSL